MDHSKTFVFRHFSSTDSEVHRCLCTYIRDTVMLLYYHTREPRGSSATMPTLLGGMFHSTAMCPNTFPAWSPLEPLQTMRAREYLKSAIRALTCQVLVFFLWLPSILLILAEDEPTGIGFPQSTEDVCRWTHVSLDLIRSVAAGVRRQYCRNRKKDMLRESHSNGRSFINA